MRGEVIYLYAFDVANEIVTKNIRDILGQRPFPFAVRTDHSFPKDVPLYQPLTIELPEHGVQLFGQAVRLVIRVYEIGVINIAVRVPFDGESLLKLQAYHHPQLDDGRSCDEWVSLLCQQVCESIREQIVRGSPPSQPEAYTVFCITSLEQPDTSTWFETERQNIAGLLTETSPPQLSADQVTESLRIRRSFTKSDLTIIDWNASLVVDSAGSVEGVLYVLELANLQLEEFRVMDSQLDRRLDQAYHDLSRHGRWGYGGHNRVLDWLRHFRVDIAKLRDEVTHITKFIGDFHLARIYLGAVERFHVPQWRESVEQRLLQLDNIYQVLKAEIYERRMLWLEIAVVICFLVDLLAIFFWKR